MTERRSDESWRKCDTCGKLAPDEFIEPDEGDIWMCHTCCWSWVDKNACHWENGQPLKPHPSERLAARVEFADYLIEQHRTRPDGQYVVIRAQDLRTMAQMDMTDVERFRSASPENAAMLREEEIKLAESEARIAFAEEIIAELALDDVERYEGLFRRMARQPGPAKEVE